MRLPNMKTVACLNFTAIDYNDTSVTYALIFATCPRHSGGG
jgi:hypothetical protein